MNYNDLQWRVRLAAPCEVLMTSPAEMPEKCPSETLMLVTGMWFIAAYFGDESMYVSPEEASELLQIARESELRGEPVSKIKVGDKVRVVCIVVREGDTDKHTTRRMSYLGKTGEVTCISSRLPSAIHVLLTQCLVTHVFDPGELKVLNVLCEQPRPGKTTVSLCAQITHLLVKNEQLQKRIEELEKRREDSLRANKKVRAKIVDIVNKGMPVW